MASFKKLPVGNKLCLARGGGFDFFDNDTFDSFITGILDEHGVAYGG